MNVNIAKIKHTKGLLTKFVLEEQAQDIAFDGQSIKFISPIKVQGEIVNSGNMFTVFGKAETVLRLNCSRCLEEFDLPVEIDFDAVFANRTDQDNDDVRIFNGDEIILDDVITEALLLNLPLKYLCSENCKGLCSQCGINLNHESCKCEKPIDSRFGILAELLNAEDKPKGV